MICGKLLQIYQAEAKASLEKYNEELRKWEENMIEEGNMKVVRVSMLPGKEKQKKKLDGSKRRKSKKNTEVEE